MINEIFSTPPTKRELETLKLVAKGYTNIQLSKIMNIEYATVKTHLASLYLKFNLTVNPASRTSESSVLRLRLALKYLEAEGYLDWNRPKYKQALEHIKKISDTIIGSEDLLLREVYELNEKISDKIENALKEDSDVKIHN